MAVKRPVNERATVGKIVFQVHAGIPRVKSESKKGKWKMERPGKSTFPLACAL
jgi:hypothetical protein